ncbi:hypothetical protein ACFUOZ_21335, partial [Paenarthrobacter sp. NPDC057355]|uniref:hypothetical protein n=1 Tax=Paenarthrobacter sp. NPDC057355 TaxID=3346105 RepID=UPI003637A07C
MVLGLWSSTAGVGAGRGSGLPGRGVPGLLPRLWGVVLAVAVTLTLFVVVDVAAGPAANATPPVVVPTTPPRVTDPNNVRRIGFPALPGQSVGDAPQFDAVEVYPGIWIANHPEPAGRWLDFGSMWGSFDDEVVWQRNVDQITADLDRLWSTGSGKTTMKVAGTLKPTSVDDNQWIDHSGRGVPAGTANPDIGVVIFPTPGAGPQSSSLNEIPAGTATYVRYDPLEVASLRSITTGRVTAADPVATLGHELIHSADAKAATNPPEVAAGEPLKIVTPFRVFEGGTSEAPTGPAKRYKDLLAAEEILTVSGRPEMTLLVKHLQAHPELSPIPVEDLSITSHPWRNRAAVQALKEVNTAGDASPELLERARLISELAMVNPTEGKIGTALETGVRTRYWDAFHAGSDGNFNQPPRFVRDPAAGVLTAEDLANPYQSSKLRPVAPVAVPV